MDCVSLEALCRTPCRFLFVFLLERVLGMNPLTMLGYRTSQIARPDLLVTVSDYAMEATREPAWFEARPWLWWHSGGYEQCKVTSAFADGHGAYLPIVPGRLNGDVYRRSP